MAKQQTCLPEPLGNRVLVKPDVQEKTAGGIALPDSVKDSCRQGTIAALGDGKLQDDGQHYLSKKLVLGATVLYGRYAASDTKGMDALKGHVIVDVDSILAVLPKE